MDEQDTVPIHRWRSRKGGRDPWQRCDRHPECARPVGLAQVHLSPRVTTLALNRGAMRFRKEGRVAVGQTKGGAGLPLVTPAAIAAWAIAGAVFFESQVPVRINWEAQ